jgi:hypothetical protein
MDRNGEGNNRQIHTCLFFCTYLHSWGLDIREIDGTEFASLWVHRTRF